MNRKTFIKLAVAASLLAPATSLAGAQDVAVDRNNSKVLSTYGDCVRTKWQAGNDKCAGKIQPNINQRRKSVGAVSRSYLAFFDFNSALLTNNAKDIIARAASDAKNNSDFIITGHADRSGSDSYNNALSNRRAAAVKAELRRLGVASHRIQTTAKGESAPLISTKDGAREPQNRRVEIVFTK